MPRESNETIGMLLRRPEVPKNRVLVPFDFGHQQLNGDVAIIHLQTAYKLKFHGSSLLVVSS